MKYLICVQENKWTDSFPHTCPYKARGSVQTGHACSMGSPAAVRIWHPWKAWEMLHRKGAPDRARLACSGGDVPRSAITSWIKPRSGIPNWCSPKRRRAGVSLQRLRAASELFWFIANPIRRTWMAYVRKCEGRFHIYALHLCFFPGLFCVCRTSAVWMPRLHMRPPLWRASCLRGRTSTSNSFVCHGRIGMDSFIR